MDATLATPSSHGQVGQPTGLSFHAGRHIRLLHLAPGQKKNPIICRLSEANLDDGLALRYTALSYCWGDPKSVKSITLAGHPYNVTTNLEAALRRLRLPQQERCLWVDAICINQSDDREKSHQITLMGLIYTLASETIIWLGECDADSPYQSLLGALRLQKPNLSAESGPHRAQIQQAFRLIDSLARNEHYPPSIKPYAALKLIMERPWWGRMWTVQEAILSRSAVVQYGTMKIPWSTLGDAAVKATEHRIRVCCDIHRQNEVEVMSDFMYKINAIEFQRTGERYELGLLIHRFRDREATDSRDKIFGLLGLCVSEAERADVPCDYSLDAAEIFTIRTRRAIERTADLFPILRMREQPGTRIPGLPTWAPDWTSKTSSNITSWTQAFRRISTYPYYQAAGTTSVTFADSTDATGTSSIGSELALLGVQIDEVAMRGPKCAAASLQEWRASHDEWGALLPRGANGTDFAPYLGGGTYWDAFWRLLMRDIVAVTSENAAFGDYRRVVDQDFVEFSRDYQLGNTGHASLSMQDQVFFMTQKGYIGMADEDIEVGDHVHVLLGGKVPFILRPVDGHGMTRESQARRFQYICDAFVQGMMDGEGLREPHRDVVILV
jgi:Heterokaryon incompatibility protein (HET)